MNSLLAPVQAAHYLGLSVRTLKEWRRLKKGPPFMRLGARVRYELDVLRAWMAQREAMPRSVSPEVKAQAMAALIQARDQAMEALMAEVTFRASIFNATGNAELAAEGATWAAEMAANSFPEKDPAQPNIPAALAVLECELLRRLHGSAIPIPEALHRVMAQEPGGAAWSEVLMDDGPVFYLAKAWAVARALGIELHGELIHGPFEGIPTEPEAYAAIIQGAAANV